MKKTLFIGSLVFLSAGLGEKTPSTFASAEGAKPSVSAIRQLCKDSTKTTSTVNSQLNLLNSGTEPKQKLCFTPAIHAKQRVKMTMNMDMKVSINGQVLSKVEIPTTEIIVEIEVANVDSNGNIYVNFYYANTEVLTNTNMLPKLIDVMRSTMKQIVGTKGSYIMDNRGNIQDFSIVFPENIDPDFKQIMNSLLDALKQVSLSIPSEAVGIGAKWQSYNLLTLNEISLNQIATYELVDLRDNVATLNMMVKQQAKPQKMNLSNLPSDVSIELESLDSQGQGRMTIDFNQIMPINSKISMSSKQKIKVNEEQIINTDYAINLVSESQ